MISIISVENIVISKKVLLKLNNFFKSQSIVFTIPSTVDCVDGLIESLNNEEITGVWFHGGLSIKTPLESTKRMKQLIFKLESKKDQINEMSFSKPVLGYCWSVPFLYFLKRMKFENIYHGPLAQNYRFYAFSQRHLTDISKSLTGKLKTQLIPAKAINESARNCHDLSGFLFAGVVQVIYPLLVKYFLIGPKKQKQKEEEKQKEKEEEKEKEKEKEKELEMETENKDLILIFEVYGSLKLSQCLQGIIKLIKSKKISIKAIMIGHLLTKNSKALEAIEDFKEQIKNLSIPLFVNLPVGHIPPNFVFQITRSTINYQEDHIRFKF
ncbi:hypothetical protein M0813_09492 [Anaeramoeba flamelloides]|uniref:LD-carboxypeptidase C-terminal domain-containing protein n=1 Tax=Anaeramoeba flamelloides TaxID=1746091 RepID=A0ABQ8X4M1_9EUKA|nr:hypothetical protein M0813_09492 [Anaeramoeba flamelloides]